MEIRTLSLVFNVLCCIQYSRGTDFTYSAFGSYTNDVSPAAFGDFNSDELTDLFVIYKNETGSFVQILLGSLKEPHFIPDPHLKCYINGNITSVVPGDFDGDGLMDVLASVRSSSGDDKTLVDLYVHWGEYDGEKSLLQCSNNPLFKTKDEPLAITYKTDLRTDLFAMHRTNQSLFVKGIFRCSRHNCTKSMDINTESEFKYPHSHAFLDVNEDNYADLVLTTTEGIEAWTYVEETGFKYEFKIPYPYGEKSDTKGKANVGQILFMDLESSGKLYAVLPVIRNSNAQGSGSSIHVYSFDSSERWFELRIQFEDEEKKLWSFDYSGKNKSSSWLSLPWSKSAELPSFNYMDVDVPTLRAGDFDNDGFVDLLATLRCGAMVKTFLLKNTPCSGVCDFARTFEIQWSQLSPNNENAVMGVFFDFMQDGILDVIFVKRVVNSDTKFKYKLSAYKNSLDYDANFLKVMVISGIDNMSVPMPSSSILGKKHFFGSNLPGPKIRYQTTNQDGIPQFGRTNQLAQSAHFALNLPYTIFGLGRSPNFVEDLIIGMFNETKQISPIIPNSQLVIMIPTSAAKNPSKWRAQLFVTPSKIVWQTVFALTGTCIVLAIVIGALHWKERREDKMERLQESQRFHFDAM